MPVLVDHLPTTNNNFFFKEKLGGETGREDIKFLDKSPTPSTHFQIVCQFLCAHAMLATQATSCFLSHLATAIPEGKERKREKRGKEKGKGVSNGLYQHSTSKVNGEVYTLTDLQHAQSAG